MNKNNSVNPYFVKKEQLKTAPFVLGVLNLILSLAAVFFAFTDYYAGLALSSASVVFSALLMKKVKTSASISLIFSCTAFTLSLALFIINNFVY